MALARKKNKMTYLDRSKPGERTEGVPGRVMRTGDMVSLVLPRYVTPHSTHEVTHNTITH